MEISLNPRWQKYVAEKLQFGAYRSIDEVIEAALVALESEETSHYFAAGELDKLLAEADEDFEKGEVYDGDEVSRELKEMSAEKRRATQ